MHLKLYLFYSRLLPHSARRRWRDIFYARVYPTDAIKYYTADGEKLNIVDLYKLPPLSQTSEPKLTGNLANLKLIPQNNNNEEIISNNQAIESKLVNSLGSVKILPPGNQVEAVICPSVQTDESKLSGNVISVTIVHDNNSDDDLSTSKKMDENTEETSTSDESESKGYDNAAFTVERL